MITLDDLHSARVVLREELAQAGVVGALAGAQRREEDDHRDGVFDAGWKIRTIFDRGRFLGL